jgi:hypothetical protein
VWLCDCVAATRVVPCGSSFLWLLVSCGCWFLPQDPCPACQCISRVHIAVQGGPAIEKKTSWLLLSALATIRLHCRNNNHTKKPAIFSHPSSCFSTTHPLMMLSIYVCYLYMDAIYIWMLSIYGCYLYMDAIYIWMLSIYVCYLYIDAILCMDAIYICMPSIYVCYQYMDAIYVWMLYYIWRIYIYTRSLEKVTGVEGPHAHREPSVLPPPGLAHARLRFAGRHCEAV